MSTRKNVERLLEVLASGLLDRLESGEATAADYNVARQFLKDNGINCLPTKDNGIGKLAEALPFKSAEDIAEEDSFH